MATHSQLRLAARYDPAAFRGLWSIYAMIRPPEDVYRDPRVVAGTLAALRGQPGGGAAADTRAAARGSASPAARADQTP